MAFKIIWSETAGEDLKAIVSYIGMDNPAAAASLAERILSRVEMAAQYPFTSISPVNSGWTDHRKTAGVFKQSGVVSELNLLVPMGA